MQRREFLYDICGWEARAIITGYRKRNRLTQQLLAEQIFATVNIMNDPKGKTPADIFPQLFETEDDEPEPQGEALTDEEANQMEAEMDAWNAQLKQEWDASHPE